MFELIHIGHSNMSKISMRTRHCIFYQFQLGNKANATAHGICGALGEDAVADRTCRD